MAGFSGSQRVTLVLLLVLTGCAGRGPILAPAVSEAQAPSALELDGTPFFPQDEYQCGPAALATVLSYTGAAVTPDEVRPLVYIPERKGSLQVEMLAASRRYHRIPYVIDPDLQALLSELKAGRPVLVLQNLGVDSFPVWHYAVVIGFSSQDDDLVLRSGIRRREILSARRFMATWKRAGYWGLVLLRPGELPQAPDRDAYLASVAAMEALAPPQLLLDAYRAALLRWPDSTLALFGSAVALHGLGDLEAAEAAYRNLLADRPGHVAALNNLAEVLADRGCYSEAMNTIDRGLARDGGSLRPVLVNTRNTLLERKTRAGPEPATCPKPG